MRLRGGRGQAWRGRSRSLSMWEPPEPCFTISELEGGSHSQFPFLSFAFFLSWELSFLVPSSALTQHCPPHSGIAYFATLTHPSLAP